MVPHTYDSMPAHDFDWSILPDKSIVFMEPDEDIPAPPVSLKNSATYTNQEGQIIGQAWSNSDVNLSPLPPFPITQGEFPVRIIPLLITVAIIALVLIVFRIRITTEKPVDKLGLRIHTEIILRNTFKKEKDTNS
jgi:hypothetical protein